jgi:hypothetical protein
MKTLNWQRPLAAAAALTLCAAASAADVLVIDTRQATGTVALNPPGPMSREQVREELRNAQVTNRMTPAGEIGDTREVLQAREDFNELQAEVLARQQLGASDRLVASVAAAPPGVAADGTVIVLELEE